ncbi:MAG: gephyrin-like molybdotransferase Glp [Dehalobacterium sp.]
MKKNISLEEAQDLLLSRCPQIEMEHVRMIDALGRVLSKDLRAEGCIPPFNRSPYDGYTFRSEDAKEATRDHPVVLEVIEEVPAGHAPKSKVSNGKAVKILTGAPIPEGADAVIKYEETKAKDDYISIFRSIKTGENIVPAGEDVAVGDMIADKGTVINPPVMGLMASLGITEVPVYKRPRIAIVSTGDELLDAAKPLTPGKIRNSNSYTLLGYIKSIGAEPVMIGIAKDKAEEVASLIQEGLDKADMVITTGGVSVGDYDVVGRSINLIGAETLYWKINIKPGSPTLAAVKDGKVILGLSGNPAAAMIIFQLLGFPYIKKLAGKVDYLSPKLEVVLKNDFRKSSPGRRFLRGKLVFEEGIIYIDNTGGQENGVLSSLNGSNLLAEIPAGSGPIKSGEKLTAYLIK